MGEKHLAMLLFTYNRAISTLEPLGSESVLEVVKAEMAEIEAELLSCFKGDAALPDKYYTAVKGEMIALDRQRKLLQARDAGAKGEIG